MIINGRVATEVGKDKVREKASIRPFLFDEVQERLAQIRTSRKKTEARVRESSKRKIENG